MQHAAGRIRCYDPVAGRPADRDRLTFLEAVGRPGLAVGSRDRRRGDRAEGPGNLVTAGDRDRAAHVRRRRQRGAAQDQRVTESGGAVVEAHDGPRANGTAQREPDRLTGGKAEARPGQTVVADDAVGQHVEVARRLPADRLARRDRQPVGHGKRARGIAPNTQQRCAGCRQQRDDAARLVRQTAEPDDGEGPNRRRAGPVVQAQHHLLTDGETVVRPAQPIGSRQGDGAVRRGRGHIERVPIDGVRVAGDELQRCVAAAMHGGEAAVFGHQADTAIGVVIRTGDQCAGDVETIVPRTEEQIEHLDRRMADVGAEQVRDRIDYDRPVADACRIHAGLTERMRAVEHGGEVEAGVHVEPGQRRRCECARTAALGAVVIDVQGVDRLRLRRLRRDGEGWRVCLAWQQHCLNDGAIGGRGAAFHRQRPANAAERVRDLRERSKILVTGLDVEIRVGDDRHGYLLVPITRIGVGGRCRRGVRDARRHFDDRDVRGGREAHQPPAKRPSAVAHRRPGRCRMIGQDHQVELARRAARDQVHFFQQRAGEAGDLDQLPFEETAVEPARAVHPFQHIQHLADGYALQGLIAPEAPANDRDLRIADSRDREGSAKRRAVGFQDFKELAGREVGVDEAADIQPRNRIADRHGDVAREQQERHSPDGILDSTAVNAALVDLLHRDRVVRVGVERTLHGGQRRAAGRRQGDGQVANRPRRRGDRVVTGGVIDANNASALDPDLLTRQEPVAQPTAGLGAARPRDRPNTGCLRDRDIAGEKLDRLHAARLRQRDPAKSGRIVRVDVGLSIRDDVDIDIGPRRRVQPHLIGVAGTRAGRCRAGAHQRAAGALAQEHARRAVVDHQHVEALAGALAVGQSRRFIDRIDGRRRVDRGEEGCIVRVLDRPALHRMGGDDHRCVPIAAVEVDIVRPWCAIRQRRLGRMEPQVDGRQEHAVIRRGSDCDPHRTRGTIRQFDSEQIRDLGYRVAFQDLGVGIDCEVIVRAVRRRRIELRHHHRRQIVVMHGDFDVSHDRMIERRIVAEHRVTDRHRPVALGKGVVDRLDVNDLLAGLRRTRLCPMGAVEHEHDSTCRDVDRVAVQDDMASVIHRRNFAGHQDAVAVAHLVDDFAGVQDALPRGGWAEDGMLFLRRHRRRYGHIDMGPGLRRLGKIDAIDVLSPALPHIGQTGAGIADHVLVDDHLALGRTCDAQSDALGDETVVGRIAGRDPVVNRAAGAVDIARHHVARDVAGDVDGVVAQTADDPHGHAGCGAEHVDRVVAFQRVDLQNLDILIRHRQPGTEDALVGHHDVVGEFGAQDHQLVEAVAAIDRNGRIDVVFDLVLTRAGTDRGFGGGGEALGQFGLRDLLHRIDPDDIAGDRIGLRQREGTHGEQIVAVVALQPQDGLVRVNGERVVAGAAFGHQRRCRAGAEPAARRRDRTEDALRRQRIRQLRKLVVRHQRAAKRVAERQRYVRAAVPLQAVDLTNLERIVTGPAIQRGDRRVVVDREIVVTAHPVDAEASVERGVVVHTLHLLRPHIRVGARIGCLRDAQIGGMHDRDERRVIGIEHRPVRRFLGDPGRAAQQEDVVERTVRAVVSRVLIVGSVNRQVVNAIVQRTGIEHVHDIVANIDIVAGGTMRAGAVDDVGVGAALTVERQGIAGFLPGLRLLVDDHRLQLVDDEEVLTVARLGDFVVADRRCLCFRRHQVTAAQSQQPNRHTDNRVVTIIGIGHAGIRPGIDRDHVPNRKARGGPVESGIGIGNRVAAGARRENQRPGHHDGRRRRVAAIGSG